MTERKYPRQAYWGPTAWLASDLAIGLATARLQAWGIEMLGLAPGDTAVDAACGSGYNLPRLSAAVGPEGRVLAFEDPCGLFRRAEARVRQLRNVTLGSDLKSLGPESVNGVIVSFNPPILLQRPDLLEPVWKALRPGRRLALVAGRFTRGLGRLVGLFAPVTFALLGHRRGDASYWRVDEPWNLLEQWGAAVEVSPYVGFQYTLVATKPA